VLTSDHRSYEDAEDAVQTTVESVVHMRRLMAGPARTWLTRIAINSALMILERNVPPLRSPGLNDNLTRMAVLRNKRSMCRIRKSLPPDAKK